MKKNIFLLASLSLSLPLWAFEWPQVTENFNSFFGQLRGNEINNSLIFEDPSEIKAADDGEIVLYMSEFSDDTDFFPSTLGNSIVIAHSDNLMTVYGNLEKDSMPEELSENPEIKKGEYIGQSGNSSWHQGQSALEFLVIDSKNNTSINPKLLMPRNIKELPLGISNVVLQNRNGKFFALPSASPLPSGFYRVYKKRQVKAVPYKNRVSVNGTLVDEITYDILRQDGNFLCVSGKRKYPKNVLYPDDEMQLLGEVTFSPGKNSLQLALVDFMGKEVFTTFIINNY